MFNRSKFAVGAVVLLVIFLMSIIWGNYTSQVELREASISQFKASATRDATAVSHFFSERKNDLEDISASREILAYYENKALGMSREYGLWASLVGMNELFKRFIEKKKVDGKSIYKQVAFADASGVILADNYGIAEVGKTLGSIKVPPFSQDLAAGIFLEGEGKNERLIMILPYVYGTEVVGYVFSCLNTEEVLSSFLKHSRQGRADGLEFLLYNQNRIFSPLWAVPSSFKEKVRKRLLPPAGEIFSQPCELNSEVPTDFLVVCTPVDGTPFCLVDFVPEEDILGGLSPWQLLLSSLVMAVILVGAAVAILIVGARNFILQVQVSESSKQAHNISIQKKKLEEEIIARGKAEKELLIANDELELRVEERTKALQDRTQTLSQEVVEHREAEVAIRVIFNKAHDAIILHDAQGGILEVNERMLEMYKIERSEVDGLSIVDDLSGPDNPFEILSEAWEKVFAGEEKIFNWVAQRPGDGSLFDVEVALNRIELGGKTVILAALHDISERLKTQNQQEEHQEFLNTIFEGIGASIFVFDPSDGVMVECNSVGEGLLSLPAEDILRTSCQSTFPFISDSEKDLLCPDIHEQGSYEEGILSMPDGTSLPVSRRLFEVHIGGKSHLVQVVFDITERKNLERKLNIAQKLESIGQLASGIAHEINTPIQYVGDSVRFVKDAFEDTCVLLGFYSKALEKSGQWEGKEQHVVKIDDLKEELDMEFMLEETPKACDRALEGVERVATIVLAMKNFSHHGEEKARAVDINKAITNTVTVSRNEWKYAAQLETYLEPDLPLVYGFSGGINQVLLNVIVNAAHAIADNKQDVENGIITVSTSYIPPFVEVQVKDTGCGISKENILKIYDPFFTTKEVGKGTGQGLAIVHDIVVEKHGGTIDIESEVGKGTTVIIRLPVKEDE